jgi:hypothetical protein
MNIEWAVQSVSRERHFTDNVGATPPAPVYDLNVDSESLP